MRFKPGDIVKHFKNEASFDKSDYLYYCPYCGVFLDGEEPKEGGNE